MRDWRGHRQPLTLDEIGRRRFWLGLAAALGFATAFYLFLGGLWASTGAVLAVHGGGLPTPRLRYSYNLLAAGLAVAVAQQAALRVWLTHRGWHEPPRTRRHRTWSLTWATMWTWLVAGYLLKLGEPYGLYVRLRVLSETASPDLDPLRDYGWLLPLLIAVVFLEQWKGLRLTYRCGRWMLAAAAVSVTFALLLALLQPLAL